MSRLGNQHQDHQQQQGEANYTSYYDTGNCPTTQSRFTTDSFTLELKLEGGLVVLHLCWFAGVSIWIHQRYIRKFIIMALIGHHGDHIAGLVESGDGNKKDGGVELYESREIGSL